MDAAPLLVFNIRPAASSDVQASDRHEVDRVPDGTSAIDPARSGLNRVLHGSKDGPNASLDAFYAEGVKRPTAQAEAPYLSVVLGASPRYFRPADPDAVGTWDQARLDVWVEVSMASLRREFGRDLVHVALHLDEDTPHLHALVAPTYGRKPRKPGKRRGSETEEEFAARVAVAQEAEGVRTVGRASHPVWSKKGSFENARRRLAVDVAGLGIDYGEVRTPDAPPGLSTREWVRREAARLARERAALAEAEAVAQVQRLGLVDAEARVATREVEAARLLSEARTEAQAIRAAAVTESEKRVAVVADREAAVDAEAVRLARDREALEGERQALAGERAQAREEGQEEGRREGHAEVVRVVQELDGQVVGLKARLTTWLRPLRALVQEVGAERDLLRRARQVLREGSDWLRQLDGLRQALGRAASGDYGSGQLGELRRHEDARILAPYRRLVAEEAQDAVSGGSEPSPQEAVEEARPGR